VPMAHRTSGWLAHERLRRHVAAGPLAVKVSYWSLFARLFSNRSGFSLTPMVAILPFFPCGPDCRSPNVHPTTCTFLCSAASEWALAGRNRSGHGSGFLVPSRPLTFGPQMLLGTGLDGLLFLDIHSTSGGRAPRPYPCWMEINFHPLSAPTTNDRKALLGSGFATWRLSVRVLRSQALIGGPYNYGSYCLQIIFRPAECP